MVTLALWLLVGFNQGEILVKDQGGGWSKRCKEMSSPASQWYCQNLCPSQPQHLSCHWSCFHTLPTLHTWTTLSSPPALALASNYVGCRSSRLTLAVKNPPANAGDIRDLSSSPESGRSPRGGNGNPLQYSCLEKPLDRGAWQATVHRVAKSQMQLKQFSTEGRHPTITFTTIPVGCFWGRRQMGSRLDIYNQPPVYGTSQVAFVVKNLPSSAGDVRDLGSGRSPGGEHVNPL